MNYFIAMNWRTQRTWWGFGKPKRILTRLSIVNNNSVPIAHWQEGDKGLQQLLDFVSEQKVCLVDGWDECLASVYGLKAFPMIEELDAANESPETMLRAAGAAQQWREKKKAVFADWLRIVRGVKLDELCTMAHFNCAQWTRYAAESLISNANVEVIPESTGDLVQITTSQKALDFFLTFGTNQTDAQDEYCTQRVEQFVRQLLTVAQ